VPEIDDLPRDDRAAFLLEMSEVAGAIRRAFAPRKVNYEALGNSVPHLHWHLVPRHADDPRPQEPIWRNPAYGGTSKGEPVADERRRALIARLLAELERADVTIERRLAVD
jgi:diadenosine tetraphosphate (Ap4A) HIT family hydrolase